MTTRSNASNRDDDSLLAAQVDIDGAKERITKIEEILNSPDKMGEIFCEAAKKSSVFRKSLESEMITILDDHDSRGELQKIIRKIDREAFWRWGKWLLGAIAWAATVAGGIFLFK